MNRKLYSRRGPILEVTDTIENLTYIADYALRSDDPRGEELSELIFTRLDHVAPAGWDLPDESNPTRGLTTTILIPTHLIELFEGKQAWVHGK
jgi:hypothetical protein